MSAPPRAEPSIGAREIAGTRAIFFGMGLAMASWGPLVPIAKARLGLDERQLGFLLLCLGLGSVVAMPLSGTLAMRFGCRRVITVAGLAAAAALPLLAIAPNPIALGLALALFGAGIGTVDVVMNIQATLVEGAIGRAMMSGFHGLVSLGGLIGAGGMTLLLSGGVDPLPAIVAATAIAVVAVAIWYGGLLPTGGRAEGPPFVLPRGPVILLGALCFVLFLTEGSMLDWSGVFLSTLRGVEPERAGFGYAAFAATMTIGRLTGDRLVAALGSRQIVVAGALVAASGLLLAVFVPFPTGAVVGFALVGAGCSNSVPVFFSAAGRQTAMPPSLAIAAVTTMGYAGLLAGPAGIGFVARATTLGVSFVLVAGLLIGVALAAPRVVRTT